METPTITASTYGTSSAITNMGLFENAQKQAIGQAFAGRRIQEQAFQQFHQQEVQQPKNNMSKRIVRVYIADTDENVPLDKSVLYTGSEKLTDLTDQELFFEVPINDVLTKHNAFRETVVNKKASERFGKEVKLEPIKIRDLKMTVVTVASF